MTRITPNVKHVAGAEELGVVPNMAVPKGWTLGDEPITEPEAELARLIDDPKIADMIREHLAKNQPICNGR